MRDNESIVTDLWQIYLLHRLVHSTSLTFQAIHKMIRISQFLNFFLVKLLDHSSVHFLNVLSHLQDDDSQDLTFSDRLA